MRASDGTQHEHLGGRGPMRDARRVNPAAHDATREPYYGKSWAVIVGIDDYGGEHPRLANAVNDAQAVETLLHDTYGFDEVIALYNESASYDAIRARLRTDLPKRVGPNDRLIFYFAGHGTTRTTAYQEMLGYLIPQDALAGGYEKYIDMDELRAVCRLIAAKHILIVLDCCFSGVAAITTRGEPGPPRAMNDVYLRTITERSAWQILTAGASDERVADSSSRPRHSAFTAALLDGLMGAADENDDNLITASELASYIRPRVARETRRRSGAGQTPFFNYLAGSREGDFVFLLPGKEPEVPLTMPQPPVSRVAEQGSGAKLRSERIREAVAALKEELAELETRQASLSTLPRIESPGTSTRPPGRNIALDPKVVTDADCLMTYVDQQRTAEHAVACLNRLYETSVTHLDTVAVWEAPGRPAEVFSLRGEFPHEIESTLTQDVRPALDRLGKVQESALPNGLDEAQLSLLAEQKNRAERSYVICGERREELTRLFSSVIRRGVSESTRDEITDVIAELINYMDEIRNTLRTISRVTDEAIVIVVEDLYNHVQTYTRERADAR